MQHQYFHARLSPPPLIWGGRASANKTSFVWPPAKQSLKHAATWLTYAHTHAQSKQLGKNLYCEIIRCACVHLPYIPPAAKDSSHQSPRGEGEVMSTPEIAPAKPCTWPSVFIRSASCHKSAWLLPCNLCWLLFLCVPSLCFLWLWLGLQTASHILLLAMHITFFLLAAAMFRFQCSCNVLQ